MALFAAFEAQPAPQAEPAGMEELRKRISDMEMSAKIRAKYPGVKDDEIAHYAEIEKKQAADKIAYAENKEIGRLATQKRTEDIKKAAVKFVKDGRILVSIAGVRVKRISEDLGVACPECGKDIRVAETYEPLFGYAEKLHDHPESARFAIESGLVIPAARNPLSNYCGGALYLGVAQCQHCHKSSAIAVQVMLIV